MISKLSDQQLLNKTYHLVEKERLALEQILEHLQEIQRRRLYADLGHSSLFKFAVKELKYSEGAAVRRINALKLLQKVPEAKAMIARGELNLTVASQAQTFSKNMRPEKTKEILERVKGKTKNQATVELLKLSQGDTTAKAKRLLDRKVPVTPDETRVHLTVSNKLLQKLEQLKSIKKLSTEKSLEYAVDIALTQYKSSLEKTRKSKRTTGTTGVIRRAVPATIKKQVLKRSGGVCEFFGCDERRYLELEHIRPFAKGGRHELTNLKLYCKVHNQRAAIIQFGQKHMDQFINRRS